MTNLTAVHLAHVEHAARGREDRACPLCQAVGATRVPWADVQATLDDLAEIMAERPAYLAGWL